MTPRAEAELAAAYRQCRRLNAVHGKTFYLATALLPAAKRPHIHALYGFARYADDLVDHPEPGRTPAASLAELRLDLEAALAGRHASHPVAQAAAATIRRYRIDERHIGDFLASMTCDITVDRYQTFDDLLGYMWGSAAVIGLLTLPILGVVGDDEAARQCAADLGIAFQLTNFIRDIGEDYRRGRIYLPLDSLTDHGVTDQMLGAGVSSPQVRELVAAEIERAREYYRRAAPGVGLLAPSSRDCVGVAAVLYGEILDEIERRGYEVLAERAKVPRRRRLRVGAAGYVRAVAARRG